MSKRAIPAILAVVLALAMLGAASIDRRPVEVGGRYLVSNGSAAVKGKVTVDQGGGWYLMDREDGRPPVSVNVANAFFVEPQK